MTIKPVGLGQSTKQQSLAELSFNSFSRSLMRAGMDAQTLQMLRTSITVNSKDPNQRITHAGQAIDANGKPIKGQYMVITMSADAKTNRFYIVDANKDRRSITRLDGEGLSVETKKDTSPPTYTSTSKLSDGNMMTVKRQPKMTSDPVTGSTIADPGTVELNWAGENTRFKELPALASRPTK